MSAQVVRLAGSTPVGGTATVQAVVVTAGLPGVVDSIKVRTAGSDGFDFAAVAGGTCTAGSLLTGGQRCTVDVSFTPKFPGERRGAIVLLDRGGLVLGVQLLVGQATGPVATFVPGTISTFAGDSVWIYAGDGGPATQSSIFLPFGIAVNAAGDLFIADSSNNRIRKVSGATGDIATLAGLGNVGASGDGGLAVLANLSNPTSLALDPAGNLYFADTGNNVVRKVSAFDATVVTVAGTLGLSGYSGDNGPAALARLNSPNGLAFDASGNLYIADTANNVVRMVAAGTGLISTVAGTGAPAYAGDGGAATAGKLNTPWGITVSAANELYIADQGNHVIRKVDAAGNLSTVVGTGVEGFSGDGNAAQAAQLNAPAGVVLDVAGNLYVADSGNNRVRKVNASTGVIDTVVGQGSDSFSGDGGPATSAGVYGPYALSLDGQGSLFIADVFHNRIRKLSSNAATLAFPPMRVDRISSAEVETLENDGNAQLNVANVTAVSESQVDDANTTCSAANPLAPLSTCVVSVKFAPTKIANPDAGTAAVKSDAANSPSTITLLGQVLSVDPATVTLASSLNPATVGTPLVFTVTVGSDGTTPTGTVTLLDGTTILTTTQLGAGGVALIPNSTLAGGSHSLTVSYSGDTSNAPAVSPVLVQVIKNIVADTTTSMAVSANVIDAGGSLRLAAAVQVSNSGAGSGTLSGAVTFTDGTLTLGSAQLVNGTAVLNVSTLSVGAHILTATYGGNSSYAASTSAGVSVKVQQATSKVTLTTASNPSNAGAALALTATLTSTGGIPSGGLVTFFDGSASLGTGLANAKGVATLTTAGPTWTVGNHLLTASYAGDANDIPGSSATYTQQVTLAQSTVSVSSSLNPSGQGAGVTFSIAATSNGAIPGGSVNVLDGGTVIGSISLQLSGVAVFTTSTLGIGTHTITVSYAGDSYNGSSVSPALVQTVTQATTAVTLTSSANPSLFGDSLSLSAVVSGTGAIPSGTVTFNDGATVIGTAVLDAKGQATISSSLLAVGAHTLTAAFGGDKNHVATVSSGLSQSILQRTTTALTASTTHLVAGKSILWTILVSGADGKPITGKVMLLDGQGTLATLTADASGTAVYSTTGLTPGQHVLSAAFSGDSLNQASTSAPLPTLVDIAMTATTLVSSSNPSTSGSAVTLTATVNGNGGTPTGTVNFYDGATVLTSASLSSGVATLSTAGLAPGYHLLTVAYSGDTNDSPSTSPAVNQQVTLKTVVNIVSSANPSLLTDSVSFTVSVSSGLATAVPTGLVSLSDGGTLVGSAAVDATGTAAFTIAAPSLGKHTLVANYAGDAENLATTSMPFVQNVTLRPSTTTFSTSATSISAGQQIILVGVVHGLGPQAPTGQVSFASGSTVFAVVPINASGVATATITPAQATYGVIATYSGDPLFAPSASTPATIVVGPTVEFTLAMDPPTIKVQSGQHESTQISITTAATFSDTLALGCAGLPTYATCTFSANQIAVGGGIPKTLTVTVDTGDPLGAGGSAMLETPGEKLAKCFLPGVGLFGLLLARRRLRKPLALLMVLAMLAAVGGTTGCGSSFSQKATAAGSYTFQVVATGNTTGATERGTVQLTVTQ